MEKTIDLSKLSYGSSYVLLGMYSKYGSYRLTDKNTGEIREGDYDNLYINIACPYEVKNSPNVTWRFSSGFSVETLKIPYASAAMIFNVDKFDPSDFSDWYFKPITLTFNRHGIVTSIALK